MFFYLYIVVSILLSGIGIFFNVRYSFYYKGLYKTYRFRQDYLAFDVSKAYISKIESLCSSPSKKRFRQIKLGLRIFIIGINRGFFVPVNLIFLLIDLVFVHSGYYERKTFFKLYFFEIFRPVFSLIFCILLIDQVSLSFKNVCFVYLLVVNISEILMYLLTDENLMARIKSSVYNIYLTALVYSTLVLVNFIVVLSYLKYAYVNKTVFLVTLKDFLTLKSYALWKYGFLQFETIDYVVACCALLFSITIFRMVKRLVFEKRKNEDVLKIISSFLLLGEFKIANRWLGRITQDYTLEYFELKSFICAGLNNFEKANIYSSKIYCNVSDEYTELFTPTKLVLNYGIGFRKETRLKLIDQVAGHRNDSLNTIVLLLLKDKYLKTHFIDIINDKKQFFVKSYLKILNGSFDLRKLDKHRCRQDLDKSLIPFLVLFHLKSRHGSATKMPKLEMNCLEEIERRIENAKNEFVLFVNFYLTRHFFNDIKKMPFGFKAYRRIIEKINAKAVEIDSYILKSEIDMEMMKF